MLCGTWYYNKEIKVENGVENAKIVTNVQTSRDWTSSVELTDEGHSPEMSGHLLRFWHFQHNSQLLFPY